MMRFEHLQTVCHIIGFDDHMGLVGLGKRIHVFNENLLFGQIFQHHCQLAGHIVTRQTDHIGRHHGKIFCPEHLDCFLHIGNDQA